MVGNLYHDVINFIKVVCTDIGPVCDLSGTVRPEMMDDLKTPAAL